MEHTSHVIKMGFFQNQVEYFKFFDGEICPSEQIKTTDFHNKKVAIIGSNQATINSFMQITGQAKSVLFFQIEPQWIVPQSTKVRMSIIGHPLMVKNKHLFNKRIKSLLALRFLEKEVQNTWLRKQLSANLAANQKVFFKSDDFYQAVQKNNCQLITWPILKLEGSNIYTINQENFAVDLIITTY